MHALRVAASGPVGRSVEEAPGRPPPPRGGEAAPDTVLHEKAATRQALDAARAAGRTVGLVPTMGALHEGHAALIRRAASECDVVAVTIFVNPLQFDRPDDLAAYPRTLGADLALASATGASLVFAPSVDEMYGSGTTSPAPGGRSGLVSPAPGGRSGLVSPAPGGRSGPTTRVHVEGLADRLEGAARPGHFDGVATVCTKLFAVAGPCRAYFGEKDFQQVAVVRRLVHDLDLPVEVVPCPTVREADGLALSSRNTLLTDEERAVAPTLHAALCHGAALVAGGERDPAVVAAAVAERIEWEPRFRLDRVDVVDADTLEPPDERTIRLRILAAAFLGRVRLIDNVGAVT